VLKLDVAGTIVSKGDEVTGVINIPEVAYDTAEDEYVFEIDVHSETAEKAPFKSLVREQIVPKLRKSLAQFSRDLISSKRPRSDLCRPAYTQSPCTGCIQSCCAIHDKYYFYYLYSIKFGTKIIGQQPFYKQRYHEAS